MSSNTDGSASRSQTSDGDLLMKLVRTELVSIPIEHWGFFFPMHVAVWRFIEAKRPGVLGGLKATFRDEPCFHGKGARWFTRVLGNRADYIDALEAIMYPITRDAPTETRERVRDRGFFFDSEIPPIETTLVRQLASTVLDEVDKAIHDGLISQDI
jgi:hypothetical protein